MFCESFNLSATRARRRLTFSYCDQKAIDLINLNQMKLNRVVTLYSPREPEGTGAGADGGGVAGLGGAAAGGGVEGAGLGGGGGAAA